MTINRERFQNVHGHITAEDGFSMYSWEESAPSCGTTRCVAGWAIFDEINVPITNPDGEPTDEVYDLAESLGVEADFETVGAALLGLSGRMVRLFYQSDHIAAEFVKRAAGRRLVVRGLGRRGRVGACRRAASLTRSPASSGRLRRGAPWKSSPGM